jgi:alanyl-tRNA synthetase
MDSFKVRQKFLDFFKKHDHEVVSSSSLIPAEDPTLLFTNAGMNQFKDLFLGNEKRSYKRATSSQKCVRAGGKHNDLDEVGFTNRHLTFFEMLGNFSFGDYFKKEAIEFAWEFLTKDLGLDGDKMCVSVYKTDDEAYNIWHKTIGIPADRIFRLGEEENFWQMGDTGPCGPCSEIHIDHGVSIGCKTKHCDPSCSCGRFTEIWNLVFMQYDRLCDGTLKPLKQTGVDTGMGLERLCMILQKKKSVFATDLFDFLIKRTEELTGVKYDSSKKEIKSAFHVLSDHVRSSSLLIADGCAPANEGRGYVLRKIIRRAALFAKKLSGDRKIFPELSKTFIETMGQIFPTLKKNSELVVKTLASEIERFATSLEQGEVVFKKYVDETTQAGKKEISGEHVFKLYDTYGFPPELTRVMAYDQGFSVDMAGFEKEMERQRKQSCKREMAEITFSVPGSIKTEFMGYDTLTIKSKITFIYHENNIAWIITEKSPFYVESGGQVSDVGFVTVDSKDFSVCGLAKIGDAIAVGVKTDDVKLFNVGDTVELSVDACKRERAVKNHTATHLLQAALVKVLGDHVKQAGSLVNEEYLRFDFSHPEAMTSDQIGMVEQIVNRNIQKNVSVKIFYTTLKDAQAEGATAFFGEKYNPEKVRVVKVGDISAELCGGTHAVSTGDIGCFKIISESALSTGTRRIVAVSGPEAVRLFLNSFATVKALGELYKAKPEEVLACVRRQQKALTDLTKTLKQMRKKLITASISEWCEKIDFIGEIPFLFLSLDGYSSDELRSICLAVEKKTPGFYFLVSEGRFLGYVSKKLEVIKDKVDLKKLVTILGDLCGLRGGGKSDFVQGSGDVDVKKVKEVVISWVQNL